MKGGGGERGGKGADIRGVLQRSGGVAGEGWGGGRVGGGGGGGRGRIFALGQLKLDL